MRFSIRFEIRAERTPKPKAEDTEEALGATAERAEQGVHPMGFQLPGREDKA